MSSRLESHIQCADNISSLPDKEKKQSARQKRDAHPRQTSRIVTFVYVFLTLFYAIFSMVKSHACHVEAYRVTFVYIVSTLFYVFFGGESSVRMAQKPGFFIHGSPFCGPQVETCVQSVGASPVGNEALLAIRSLEPIHQRLDHQVSPTSSCSLRLSALLVGAPKQQWPFAKGHPNPTKHVGRNRCLQHKKR